MQRRPERISSLSVEQGLYVLRYVSAAASGHPTIFVRPSPGDDESVTFIPFPGEPADRLASPGSLMVIAVDRPAMMQITAQAASPDGSLNAELRMEPLKPGVVTEGATSQAVGSDLSTMAVPVAPKPTVAAVEPLRLVQPAPAANTEQGELILRAHLARRGDVRGGEGIWIGGPDAPAPVEGVVIEAPSSLGSVQIQVLVAGESRWSDWLSEGVYGGSRGRATPLVGLRLRFLPAAGVEATMEGEALFLGSAIIRKDGQEMEFRSAAGLDPLLGIKLAINRGGSETAKPEPGLVSTVPQGGRVRVFRASARRSF